MPIQTIQLCLSAITTIPERLHLISMWEDNNIDDYEDARAMAEWVNDQSGGGFILIEQYNIVKANCFGSDHWDCWHYDPAYALYLVPLKVWQACSADATGLHAEHQHEYGRCKFDPAFEVEQEERRRLEAEIPF